MRKWPIAALLGIFCYVIFPAHGITIEIYGERAIFEHEFLLLVSCKSRVLVSHIRCSLRREGQDKKNFRSVRKNPQVPYLLEKSVGYKYDGPARGKISYFQSTGLAIAVETILPSRSQSKTYFTRILGRATCKRLPKRILFLSLNARFSPGNSQLSLFG